MKYYFLLLMAVIIGQTFTAAIAAWIFQRSNDAIDYFTALKLYLKKEFGSFAVIISFTVLLMFILSDWMDLSVTRADLLAKGQLTRFEQAQAKFKTVAVIYGAFAQWVAYFFYKKGKTAIEEYGKKNGIDLNELNKN